jgi:Domain of unknown function (DUF4126)
VASAAGLAGRCDPGTVELLTGAGLAASAGLNAYIPLLALGLMARYTDLIQLPSGWQWLSNGWVLLILGLLLSIEVVADKVPVVDHVNDMIQTVVRPASGGLVFGAGASSETATVADPGQFFTSNQWVPVAVGVLIALGVHVLKAAARPVVNATTAGMGTPVVSTAEDATSAIMSVVAIVLPVLVLVILIAMLVGFVGLWRRRRRRRDERAAARAAGFRV